MKTTVVVGLGSSGISAARLLNREGREVVVLEKSTSPKVSKDAKQLQEEGIEVRLGNALETRSFQALSQPLDCIVISPGVPWDHPTLQTLRQRGVSIKGEMAIAWERLKKIPWIGVTGTNGKTTVTNLLSHVLEANGTEAPMAGNVGFAATQLAIELTQVEEKCLPDWLVVELSSYQIEAAPNIKPRIGIWTNLTPDHLERHGSLDSYRKIKRSLLERSQIRIYNGDDPDLISQRKNLNPGIWISTKGKGTSEYPNHLWINKKGMVEDQKQGQLFKASSLDLPGKHNQQNLLLVTAAALQIGIPAKGIEMSLRSFKGLPHRLEKVGHLKRMEIYNDSKATNYDASSIGMDAMKTPIVLLAGGQIKEGNPSDWLENIKDKACGVVFFGANAETLEQILQASGFTEEIHICKELQEAVLVAINIGIEQQASSLLFSPACSSFDAYPNFEARGNHFRQLIKEYITTKRSNQRT